MNNQVVTVNLIPGLSTPAVIQVSQYDVGRPLTIKVFDGAGAASFGASVTATIVGTKPSGLGFTESGTIAGNTVTLNTTLAMTQERGMFPVEIRFTQTGENIGTTNFILAVEPSPHPDGTTDGTKETMQNLETRLHDEIDELSDRIDDIEAGGSGLSQTEKNLILTSFSKAAYAENDAESAYDALEALWTTTTRTITYNLSNVVSSNTQTSIESGQIYTTALGVRQGYTLNSVAVTMGGVDITNTAYSSGTITIPSVTGNIVITATAVLAAESITATYTQSGTVYDTDSLDSLKADLVVTANYSGGTSETVPASDYTLSGTLTEGTSTITVNYAGLTTTFSVTVTHYTIPALYDWDFTSSLTDSSSGETAVLTGCTQSSSGISFTANNQAVQLTSQKVSIANKTFILDISSLTGTISGAYHARLFMSAESTNTQTNAAGFAYRATYGWTVYTGSAWGTALDSTTYPFTFFNNKRLKIYVGSDLKMTISYADIGSDSFTEIGTFSNAISSTYGTDYWVIGGTGNNQLKTMTLAALKVYEGEV